MRGAIVVRDMDSEKLSNEKTSRSDRPATPPAQIKLVETVKQSAPVPFGITIRHEEQSCYGGRSSIGGDDS